MSRIITQGVHTEYYGPTNTKGSRIRAKAWAGVMWFNYDHALNAEQNHVKAAEAYFKAKEWKGEIVTGGDAEGRGYYHVQLND